MSAADHLRLFPDTADPLLRFKAEAEQREAELAAERKREAREERGTESKQVALLRAEIEGLRHEIAHQHEVLLDVCGTALGEYGNKIFDHCEGLIQSIQRELFALVERRFAELQAKIEQARADVLAADGKPRKDFRFANEKTTGDDDEPLELPQLSKARGLN
jgi:hypothetical protein